MENKIIRKKLHSKQDSIKTTRIKLNRKVSIFNLKGLAAIEKTKFFEVIFLYMTKFLQACSDGKLEIIKKVLNKIGYIKDSKVGQ